MSFLKNIIKESKNEFASIVEDGIEGSDIKGFVDTGSYSFNALLSGSLYGGMPDNKIMAIAGESATGKTYFTLGIVGQFLKDFPDGAVLYFDTEQAVTSSMFKDRGIDPNRIAVFPVNTVEEFRHQAVTILDSYLALSQKEKKPMMIVLDSLGMLSTNKEMADTAEGKTTKDMTRAQVIKATFRVLTLKLGKANVPLIMTNHTYDIIGSMYPTKEMGGGSGLKYAASTIVYLSKRKEKDSDGSVVGNVIHCKLYKGRITKENKMVDVMLRYDSGLDRYYGLVDLAIKYGIFKKVSTRIELPDGKTAFEKNIRENPEKYFTDAVMVRLEDAASQEFKYGMQSAGDETVSDDLDEPTE
jgi:RecA/RadA recombinase